MALERFGVRVKTRLMYKVKMTSKEFFYGGFWESYRLFSRYAELIKEINLSSYALVTWTENTSTIVPKFVACFFSFAAQFRGF